ncbi:MAG: phosphoribosyltransferase [Desulfurococcales archaeon]|nr:phosphoribosyltransferase [Desulfurococcales archaeon]
MAKVRTQLVSWEDVVEWSRGLAEKVRASGYMPDVVIAVARGGYVPARLICDFLMINNLVSIQSQHWTEAAKAEERAIIKFPYEVDLSGMKALLVDDIVDTGESLLLAKDFIMRKWKPTDVKIAVLQWISSAAKFKPEYYHLEVREWVWFQYPWTRLEDTYQFFKKMLSEEAKYGKNEWTFEELVKSFMEWYEIDVGDKYFRDAVNSLVRDGFLEEEKGKYKLKL